MKNLRRIAVAVMIFMIAGAVFFWQRPIECFNELLYLRSYFSGVESQYISVAGHRVHYNVAGPVSGPVVVLVHGLGGHAEDWRNLLPYLTKAGFRVYMIDLPGYGRSERPVDFSYSVPDEAEAVVGFMDALGLKQVDLGGWSMGGGIVQHIAYRHPERMKRLILFDAAGLKEMPEWDTRLFTPTTPQEVDQLDALLMPKPQWVPEFVAKDIVRVSNERAWVIHRALATMLTGRDATDEMLAQFRMPVLLVWGSEDHVIPLRQGEKMHGLVSQSQLEVVSSCGHLAPVQCANEIGPRVVDFLKQ